MTKVEHVTQSTSANVKFTQVGECLTRTDAPGKAPEVGLAWTDENDVVNIRMSTQVIEHFRAIADAIGVPHNKVRIHGALVGGGFGGKEDITVEVYLALLAQKTNRPVRLEYSREDSFVGHGKRHPFNLTYRTGVTNDGTPQLPKDGQADFNRLRPPQARSGRINASKRPGKHWASRHRPKCQSGSAGVLPHTSRATVVSPSCMIRPRHGSGLKWTAP